MTDLFEFSPVLAWIPARRRLEASVWVVHWLIESDAQYHYYLDGLDEEGSRVVRIDVTAHVNGPYGGAFIGESGIGSRLPHAIKEGPDGYFWGVYEVAADGTWKVVRWQRSSDALGTPGLIGTIPNPGNEHYNPRAMFFTPDGTLYVPPGLLVIA